MLLKKILVCCSMLLVNFCFAQINIIPQPVKVTQPSENGSFSITSKTVILANANTIKSAEFLNKYLKEFYGFSLKVNKSVKKNNAILIKDINAPGKIAGAYDMEVSSRGIEIKGHDAEGAFYGMQTLLQLLPTEKAKSLSVPYVSIHDEPRFEYRGLHLDVCRHFYPVEFIKKYIDFIALHKMNYFHWHLTDDQGWRIEIKKYPRLTEIGGYRNGTIIGNYPGKGNDGIRKGGFYTQEQVKEVVKYAADRYVTIIPEIEMPGHASAAIAAYPQLSCFPNESTKAPKNCPWYGDTTGKQVQQTWGVFEDVFCPSEYTFKFLEGVLDEVIPLFPAEYVHIGGDECPKEFWKRSAFCQQLIREKGLKDEHGLQSYFVTRMEKYINSKGKQIIGWDEILEGGLAPNATVMSWRGEKGGIEAAKQKHDVIMTPNSYCYFDYSQSKSEDSVVIGGFVPLQKVYSYDPLPSELKADETKYIWGAQANLWTEYMNNTKKVEYMLFPRLSALSEVLWSPKSARDWQGFLNRQKVQTQRYNLWKVNYSKALEEITTKK